MTTRDREWQDRQYVIIGAGPAGVQLGYFLQQANRSYAILEANSTAGSYFRRFPRHRKLLSINKVYTGYPDRERQLRWDWNSLLGPEGDVPFSAYSREYFPDASTLARYVHEFAERHAIAIAFNTQVTSVRHARGDRLEDHGSFRYEIETSTGVRYRAQRLIIATGFCKPLIPEIEGIEHSEPYVSMSVDPADYIDQRVLILGKGNSAFETAEALVPTARSIHLASPQPVEFAWRSHYVGNLRAINNNLLDTYQLKSQNAVLDARVERIVRDGDALRVTMRYVHNTEVEELVYDRVLCCTGFRFDRALFAPTCLPEMRSCGRLPAMNAAWESTNLPGVHFAGTLTQVRDYHRSSSAFIHGFRYNARALFRMLEASDHAIPWPSRSVSTDEGAMTRAAFARINGSSALWQQFGYLCDVIAVGANGARYYEEVPIDYLLESEPFGTSEYFTITLEYGEDRRVDPFNQGGRVVRTDGEHGDMSAFLHPVVRHHRAGELLATHHVIEDLAAEWLEPEHVEPLERFLGQQLASQSPKHSDVRELGKGTGRRKVG